MVKQFCRSKRQFGEAAPRKRGLAALIVVGLTLIAAAPATAMEVAISISGVRNDEGHILIALYDNDGDFLDEGKALAQRTVRSQNGIVQSRISDLPAGDYAIAVLHDENDNLKMDYRFFLPREGFGFSNNVRPRLSAPKFADAKFLLDGEVRMIAIGMQYR
ncbi:MAG: DUF2141 domain-containing protein [Proteobacteria bacterium]|nr:DUF2141 domain-containing protein [Pseudomonadota bacterium]